MVEVVEVWLRVEVEVELGVTIGVGSVLLLLIVSDGLDNDVSDVDVDDEGVSDGAVVVAGTGTGPSVELEGFFSGLVSITRLSVGISHVVETAKLTGVKLISCFHVLYVSEKRQIRPMATAKL